MNVKEEYLETLFSLEIEEIKDSLINILSQSGISYQLDFRVKSLDRIHQKQLLFKERNRPCELFDIPDILGFRISVDSKADVYSIFALLNTCFEPSRVVDYFNSPKSTGYQAFNCFYDNWAFNTEIQIMTNEMRDWTNATHDEHYKMKYGDIIRIRDLTR